MCEADEVSLYGLTDLFKGQQFSWRGIFLIADTFTFRKITGKYKEGQPARLRDIPAITVPTARIIAEISDACDSFFVEGVVEYNLESDFILPVLHNITYTFLLDLQEFDETRIKKEVKFRFAVISPEQKMCVLGNIQLRFP